MIKAIYLQTWEILKKIPVKLWGITLLAGFLEIIAVLMGGLPIISIPLTAALGAGLCAVFYKAYKNGGETDTKTLLKPFEDWKTFKHVAGGMCWMYLWLFLWFIIPVAGPFLAIYKSFQYAFTPYILTQEPTVSGRQALKKSIEDTKGYKGNMFLAIVLPAVAVALVTSILSALGFIPYAGVVFVIINVLLVIAYYIVAPLFFGLVRAGFYDFGKKPAYRAPSYTAPAQIPSPAQEAASAPSGETESAPVVNPAENVTAPPSVVCPTCGSENSADKKFCMKCGAKL